MADGFSLLTRENRISYRKKFSSGKTGKCFDDALRDYDWFIYLKEIFPLSAKHNISNLNLRLDIGEIRNIRHDLGTMGSQSIL